MVNKAEEAVDLSITFFISKEFGRLLLINCFLYGFHVLNIHIDYRGKILLVITPFVDFILNTDAIWMISTINKIQKLSKEIYKCHLLNIDLFWS